MDLIPKDSIFEFNPDTLQCLRQQYDLEEPGRMDEAINLLEQWIKKQNHFLRKEYPRDYLERTIIISKGSVERAKKKLDKICTYRTLCPDFFGAYNVKEYQILNDLYGAFLPKLTKDHYRVYFMKNKMKRIDSGFLNFYRYFFMQFEYLHAHDYCNGLIIVIDNTEANLLETLKWTNVVDLKEAMSIIRDGYGVRIKGMHFITESKIIEAIIAVFKQVVSAKLAGRFTVHTTVDSLYEYIPKDILPVEYGGKEKSILELQKQSKDVITCKEFSDYLKDMSKACTNEALRQINSPAHEYSGIQGTFRNLSVD